MSDDDDTVWTLISFKPRKKPGGVQSPPVSNACPKCGRIIGRGRHFHVKHCKGIRDDEAERPDR